MGSIQLPASTTCSPLYQCMLQVATLSSLRQRGSDIREFAIEFRSAAEGLNYNNAALKDLFSYALDEPISTWRRFSMEHLSFEEFVDFLAHSRRQSEVPFPIMAISSEPLLKMAAFPEPLQKMATSLKPLHKWGPGCLGLVSSLADPPMCFGNTVEECALQFSAVQKQAKAIKSMPQCATSH